MVLGALRVLVAVVAVGVGAPPPSPTVTFNDIVVGTGAPVQPGDVVTVNFEVQSQDGKEAANTFKRGLPYSFVLGDPKMPPMWPEGLKGMRVGGERRFVAPPAKAYGAAGLPPIVPGSATLTVHVWLVKSFR